MLNYYGNYYSRYLPKFIIRFLIATRKISRSTFMYVCVHVVDEFGGGILLLRRTKEKRALMSLD